VLNPDLSANPDGNVSVFPLSFDYEWKILGLVRSFDPAWVSFGNGLDTDEKIAQL